MDAVKAGHIGDIITFLEWSGFNLSYIKKETLTLDKLYKHYEHLKDMSFFKDLLDFMTSGDSVVIFSILKEESDNFILLLEDDVYAAKNKRYRV